MTLGTTTGTSGLRGGPIPSAPILILIFSYFIQQPFDVGIILFSKAKNQESLLAWSLRSVPICNYSNNCDLFSVSEILTQVSISLLVG